MISYSGVTLKKLLDTSASATGVKSRANHRIMAAGTTLIMQNTPICMKTLQVSKNQIGRVSRQALAVRRSSVQRPIRRAGAPSQISCVPTSRRMGVNGVIQLPRPTLTLLATAARIPILQPLSR